MSVASPSFDVFAVAVAGIAECDPETITEDSLLVRDLGFDSLGFAELAVLLADRYGGGNFALALEQIDWESLSIGAVFENYVVRSAEPSGADG